jgi:hypothetical protein
MSHIPANSQIQLSPVDNDFYIVFNDPSDAFDTAQRLDIAPHCFGGYDNAILLSDWMDKMAQALTLNAALVERAGQRCETPASWSFDERDTAREAAQNVLGQIPS